MKSALSSQRRAMRSRQNSLPAVWLASWYFCAPPLRIFSAAARMSSLLLIGCSV